VIALLVYEIISTAPVRGAVSTYTSLITAANHQDLAVANQLCTARYRRTHSLRAAPEGGIVGLPRNINKNFQAWRHGRAVWLCPTNRVGPVYQFLRESGTWKFDGPIGILNQAGVVELGDTGMDGM
jgi:hypothetical protein